MSRKWIWLSAFGLSIGVTRVVQLWIRPWAYVHAVPGRSVLDWTPSFLAAFALVCMMAAWAEPGSGSFRGGCLAVLGGQLLREIEQDRGQGHYFDWHDVAGIVAGAALAFMAAELVPRRRRRDPGLRPPGRP